MKTARSTIRLLREFTVEAPELGVSELSRRLGLDKASIHRLLRSLCDEGIVEQDEETKKYRLGLSILELAAARLKTFGFMHVAAEEMRILREEVGESIALHVQDRCELVCVQYAEASHPLTVRFTLGERSPIHVTAGGLIHLAHMQDDKWKKLVQDAVALYPTHPVSSARGLADAIQRARKDQTAISDETFQKGIRGLATSIRDSSGYFVATLSVVAPTSRKSIPELKRCRTALMNAAGRIGANIRHL